MTSPTEEKIKTLKYNAMQKTAAGARKPGQRIRVQSVNKEKSLTQQNLKDQANIHCILKKYAKTGLLPQRTVTPIDPTAIPADINFQDAMNFVNNLREKFELLPSDLREKFGNVDGYVKFVKNPDNKDEAIKLGIFEAPEPSADHSAGAGEGAVPDPVSENTTTGSEEPAAQ